MSHSRTYTYIRETSCQILLHGANILTTYKTHTSERHHAIYSYTRKTYSLPQKHIHHRYIASSHGGRGSLYHRLRSTHIRDTSCHIVFNEDHFMTHSGAHPSDTLGNRHIRDTCHLLIEDHYFVTGFTTHPSEIPVM